MMGEITKWVLFLVLILSTAAVHAQQTDSVSVNQFRHTISAGLLLDENNGRSSQFSADVMSAYVIKRWRIGLGIGVDRYKKHVVMPLFAHVQFDLLKKSLVPYYFARVGYGKVWSNNEEISPTREVSSGGMSALMGVGLRRDFHNMEINLNVGYQLQRVNSQIDGGYYWGIVGGDDSSNTVEEQRDMHRVVIKLGVSF